MTDQLPILQKEPGALRPSGKRSRKPKPKPESKQLSADAQNFVPSVAGVVINGDGTTSHRSETTSRGKHRNRNRRGRGGGAASLPRTDGSALPAPSTPDTSRQDLMPESRKLSVLTKEAETVTERLQQAISGQTYECCICCDVIKRHQPVFEDQNCWAVFHLSCVSKWAKRALQPESGEPQETWRCPACNSSNTEMPKIYTCWCTKQVQPEVSRTSPHSCGQTCGKPRNLNCPHPCLLPCHPGPCPPCTDLGPAQQCFCGRNSTQRRCIDTNYTLGAWSCQETCGEIMPCDVHTCPRPCHPGLCGMCMAEEATSCFCGKETKSMLCSEKGIPQKGIDADGTPIEGLWSCHTACNLSFDCNIHKCQKPCHTRTSRDQIRCPFSPDSITTCHCGQTQCKDLLAEPRSQCTDSIPVCEKVCSRALPCGHKCRTRCHEGPCPECTIELEVLCQCKTTSVTSTCQDMQLGLQPSCDKVCKASMSCARHICQNRCCSAFTLAQNRVAQRPKGRQAAQMAARFEEIEAEHLCTRSCGRTLTCRNHSCGVLCHSGPCPTCLIASFDDLSCHCGKTSIPAPIACGTVPPECKHPCTRGTSCGHPSVPHNCHLDNETCPRCPYLVERLCLCGKRTVKNQPCWKSNVSCGQICEQPLSCGNHQCLQRCHPPGECDEPCVQVCGKPRSGCGHPCTELCHSGLCPQDADHPCQANTMAVCACGTTKMAIRCNSQDSDPLNQTSRFLKCTDFCAIIERNKKLTAALGVSDEQKPVQTNLYEESTLEYYKENRIWCSTIEQAFRTFLKSPDKTKSFKPMKADLRQFVHEMADVYGMKSESMDEEPKRSVQILKTEHTTAPLKSLAQSTLGKPAEATGETMSEKKKGQAYNAFVLVTLRFGTTEEEVRGWLDTALAVSVPSKLQFEIQITEDGEYAYIQPLESEYDTEQVEHALAKLRPFLRQGIVKADIANSVELCWIDRNGNMAYRESKKRDRMNALVQKSRVATTRNVFDALALD